MAIPLQTIAEQREVEKSLLSFLDAYAPGVSALWSDQKPSDPKKPVGLYRCLHVKYIKKVMSPSRWGNEYLYCSQPWLVFWAAQTAETLGATQELYEKVSRRDLVQYLMLHLQDEVDSMPARFEKRRCFFAGSPRGKAPHLLSSFVACCALCILDIQALQQLPREAIKRWLLSLRSEEGSFSVNRFGETDLRCSYAVAVIVALLRLDDPETFCEGSDVAYQPLLTSPVVDYVASCQTHEGGFSCSRDSSEAHGSYTFCALGALFIMRGMHKCHLPSLRRWLAARQCSFEGGFNGRTNKVVDVCYSYWVGASHAIVLAEENYRKLLCVTQDSTRKECQRFILSKELAMLHCFQVIDINGFLTTELDLWDKEESKELMKDDLVDQFLSVEDASCRVTPSVLSKRKALSELDAICAPASKSSTTSEFLDADVGDFLYNQRRLQLYILQASQESSGGLRDKPGVHVDVFHTCYAISGLSLSQNSAYANISNSSSSLVTRAFERGYIPGKRSIEYYSRNPLSSLNYGIVLPIEPSSPAAYNALVRSINPLFNLHRSRIEDAWKLWGLRPTL